MPVSQKLEFAEIDELYLDPVNPRLGRHYAGRNVKQEEVLRLMETWKLDELAVSFLESGQFWTQEALICVREELYGKERLVVIEGNRRLAALMCLRDTLEGRRQERMWKELVHGEQPPKELFTKIPYLLATDRKSVEAYLGFRHVTGIEQWRPSEKAEFIARMVDRGMPYDEVRRKIGARLDVLCYLRFEDGRGNFPAFFVQCASGKRFDQKLKDPHLGVWTDLVSLVPSSLPRKGFVTPFVFPQRQFERYAIQSEGLLLDRCRLLSAEARKPDWLDENTAKQIRKWGKPFVKMLPWPK